VSGDTHQKFTSKIKIPLTGGILVFLGLLYNFDQYQLSYVLFYFLILLLGVFSDLKLIKSAKMRLIFQLFIVLIFVSHNDIIISDTRVDLLNNILSNQIFNYFFVSFCILIVINGSNFFDGLNTLNLGYYLLISFIIIFLSFDDQLIITNNLLNNLIFILIIGFLINSFNKLFIGDSGSYLLGFVFSVMLINLYIVNNQISPFFIILLLWYPSFETLFSMIRKNILNRSPMRPDSRHLHQLIFYFIKQKYSKKVFQANLISANIINLYNLLIFLISSQFIMNTQIQIILILLNLIVYTVIYFKLFVYRFKKL
jgi:UDP-N-acetylmuramyl pentapeptide phosphotransferase/UDP-N-acetylglucosamine-1-phosphate transferase|tara:strand:+ start:947 stop:1882 length:936 start_codon:yes stop_codon:yes gene_type:complete